MSSLSMAYSLHPSAIGALLLALLVQTSAFQAFAPSHPGSSVVSTTRLGYRDLSSNGIDQTQKQASVDDYLVFLERRYNRMEGKAEPEAQFSAWKWLTHSGAEELQQANGDTDNALHVLGLANLASQKLLHKYHLAKDQKVIDVTTTPAVAQKVVSVVKPLAKQRSRLLAFQTSKTRALLSALFRTAKSSPKTLKNIVGLGGGKNTMAITFTAIYAVMFFVVRPLAQTIVSEGAHHV